MAIIVSFPKVIDDGRIDMILKLLDLARRYPNGQKRIDISWSRTVSISPGGYAILASVFDALVEQKNEIKNLKPPKKITDIPVVKNFMQIEKYSSLPEPNIHNYDGLSMIIRGMANSIDTSFVERINEKFMGHVSEEILYAGSLIINELMQNSLDNSTSERFYAYAGIWQNEFHAGLLDMGITIPAKLEQKYVCAGDLEYLELSLEKGSSTRRQRTGGFGLYYLFELLKENKGKLTIVSRGAQLRRYFETRKSQKGMLKYPLAGTWCFARFSLEG